MFRSFVNPTALQRDAMRKDQASDSDLYSQMAYPHGEAGIGASIPSANISIHGHDDVCTNSVQLRGRADDEYTHSHDGRNDAHSNGRGNSYKGGYTTSIYVNGVNPTPVHRENTPDNQMQYYSNSRGRSSGHYSNSSYTSQTHSSSPLTNPYQFSHFLPRLSLSSSIPEETQPGDQSGDLRCSNLTAQSPCPSTSSHESSEFSGDIPIQPYSSAPEALSSDNPEELLSDAGHSYHNSLEQNDHHQQHYNINNNGTTQHNNSSYHGLPLPESHAPRSAREPTPLRSEPHPVHSPYTQREYHVLPPPAPFADPVFVGRRDVRDPGTVRERQIVSSKGTVRGFKNRVRAGIATFWAQPEDERNYRQLEQGKIVLYATSMSVVRETSERCKIVRCLLQNHMVRYEERDLYMSREIQLELRHRLAQEGISAFHLPHVFADGIHIGSSEELEKLNEAGELRGLLNHYQKITVRIMCDKCGGYRYVPCDMCHGSKRSLIRNHFTEEFCALRCMHCDDNGLKRCDMCVDQQE